MEARPVPGALEAPTAQALRVEMTVAAYKPTALPPNPSGLGTCVQAVPSHRRIRASLTALLG